MSDTDRFVGFWKVLNCTPVTKKIEPKGIQGTVFQLSKTGDVFWKIPDNAMPTALFKCDTYEVVLKKPYFSEFILRFGAYKGHIIDCTVNTHFGAISINDGWCLFVCIKFQEGNEEVPFELPFSFLPALQDGYFSDLIIKGDDDKEYKVHSSILKLSLPKVDWSSTPTPISNLSEDVTFAILYFLYAHCLPAGLNESTITNIISVASKIHGLSSLVSLCHVYIRNMTLKKQIFNLVSDIHTCASQIIEYFTNKQSSNSLSNVPSDPAKLCFAVKNSIRETAVAIGKFLMLCDLYTKQKNELSREEEHEIFLYAKSRIPVFMNQFESFLQAVKTTFNDLLPSQRQELACYLVPEMETIFDIISSLLVKAKTVIEYMSAAYEFEEKYYSQILPENFQQCTDSVLNRKMWHRLLGVIHKISIILFHLHQKKEHFKVMTNDNKIRSIARNLEQLMEELPIFVMRVEEFTSALDEKLQWNESEFYFKVGTSKMSEVIKKLILHKKFLQDLLTELCDFVQRDAFSQSLVSLGLLKSFTPEVSSDVSAKEDFGQTSNDHSKVLNSRDSVCVSPPACRNHLSEAASELLKSGLETDMTFEIIPSAESDSVGDQTEGASAQLPIDLKPEICKMAAHRVIVASRCDWFRRALLSGMQEDINRKIQVHNTSPYLFSLFLQYLYSGQLDCKTLSVDNISELLLLGDRYELDSLKQVCEYGLKPHLDADSVLYFYNMADQFNAKILKNDCKQFITEHPDVIDSELFEELPDNIQSEVYDIVISRKPLTVELSWDKCFSNTIYNGMDFEGMIANVHINSNLPSPDSDDAQVSQDFPRLEATLEQLREIVGHGASRSQLVRIILAADYDLNRALNFYYSSS